MLLDSVRAAVRRPHHLRFSARMWDASTVAFREDPDGDQFFALRTFRRDGSPASTPIWLAPVGERWYGYTPGRSWKVARIHRDSRVQVAPSTFDGTPTAQWRSGSARVLPARELRTAKRAMTAKYGNKFRVFVITTVLGGLRERGGAAVGLEIRLDDQPAGSDPAV